MKNTGLLKKLCLALLLALAALLLWLPCASADLEIPVSCSWDKSETYAEFWVEESQVSEGGITTTITIVGEAAVEFNEEASDLPYPCLDRKEVYNVGPWSLTDNGKTYIYEGGRLEKTVEGQEHSLTEYPAVAQTCTEDGNIHYWYCDNCGNYFASSSSTAPYDSALDEDQVFLQALDHVYGDPSWSWTGYTAATATFTCTREGCTEAQEGHSRQEPAQDISDDGATPSCAGTVNKIYTASVLFNSQTYYGYKTEVLQPIPHLYGDPDHWEWTGYTAAKAVFPCTRNCGHSEEQAAYQINASDPERSCAGTAEKVYTATVQFNGGEYHDQKTETLEALPHQYGDPSWAWTGYTAAKAAFICPNCPEGTEGHSKTLDADTINDNGAVASCQGPVNKVYTASVAFGGHTYTDDKTETLGQIAHAYGIPDSWIWDGYTAAKAVFICPNCTEAAEGHRKEVSAYSIVNDGVVQKCEETVRTYTAYVDFNGHIYPNEVSETLQPLGHIYGEPVWTWKGTASAEATFTCSRNGCGHSVTVQATDIENDGVLPSLSQTVVRTYTAYVQFNDMAYTDQLKEMLQPLNPYDDPAPVPATKITLTFVVVGGAWNNGSAEPITVSGYDWVALTAKDIPEAGNKPADGYIQTGSWINAPTEGTYYRDATFTFSYIPKLITLTFKVDGGMWDNGSAEPITVSGYGSRLFLETNQIPSVGNNPDIQHNAQGSWDVTPASAYYTEDMTFTFTYGKMKQITLTFKVDGGTWNNGSAEPIVLSEYGDSLTLLQADIPQAGKKPDSEHSDGGGWNQLPTAGTYNRSKIFVFSYPKEEHRSTIFFRVVGGMWDNGSAHPIPVSGEGKTVHLRARDIPSVGNNPDSQHSKGGQWDVQPIETDYYDWTTFTFAYNVKEYADDVPRNGLSENGEEGNQALAVNSDQISNTVNGGLRSVSLDDDTNRKSPAGRASSSEAQGLAQSTGNVNSLLDVEYGRKPENLYSHLMPDNALTELREREARNSALARKDTIKTDRVQTDIAPDNVRVMNVGNSLHPDPMPTINAPPPIKVNIPFDKT